MQRQFNVFSPVIVVYEGESFDWVVNPAELGTASAITVLPAEGTWPLDKPSYTVTPGTPVKAKVIGNVGADFMCDPPALNVTTQKIITTPCAADGPCNGAVVAPGNYFIWLNETADTLMAEPDPANSNYWPLPQPKYAVPPKSWIAVEVPAYASAGSYPVIIANKLGAPQCPQLGQPVIIVQSNGGPPGRKKPKKPAKKSAPAKKKAAPAKKSASKKTAAKASKKVAPARKPVTAKKKKKSKR
ncbi:MAG TPA: hypothetical protein VHX60_18990 [Acidobacteriaceae bacterium]|jgi:hypothetical protein|nr:hypothetical protein [Acidobacteriaceae bacterium]